MMLSMPEQWQTYHSWISEQGPEGKDAIRTAVRELEAAGYLTKEEQREGGKIVGVQWDWHAEPVPVAKRTRFRVSTVVGFSDDGKTNDGKSASIKDPVQKGHNTPSTETKESEETGSCSKTAAVGFSSVAAQWKPSSRTKDEQLSRLAVPKSYPSQEEFDQHLEDQDLGQVINYRPDLYAELCRNKWHQWNETNNKWVPVRNWRRYVTALDSTIENVF